MSSRAIGVRRRSGASQASSFIEIVQHWLPRAMETLWLATVAIVPLAFAPQHFMIFFDVPKVAALRIFTGLLAALWAIEWAVKPHQGHVNTGGLWGGFGAWLGTGVSRWTLMAAAIFLIVNAISTLFAPVISVSLWGNSPGRDGYGLYNMASYFILFAVIATHAKSSGQLWRILYVIAGTSTVIAIYGILQHVGVVPLYESVVNRVQGTFGNALFAGAYFSLALPISASAGLAHSLKSRSPVAAPVWTGIIAIQLAALLLTLSRGPWVALAVALSTWLLLVLIVAGGRVFAKAAILLGVAFAIALAVSYIPGASVEADQDTGLIAGRTGSIGSELTVNGLNGRIAIWKRAASIAADRPWFDPTHQTPVFIRHLFGYGPEMFLYATPIRWVSGLERSVNASAHNYLFQVLVELGIFGLAAFSALIIVTVLGGGNLLMKNRGSISAECAIIFSAFLAALVGRIVEQTTGVARISDLTLFWVIAGLIAAMSAMIRSGGSETEDVPKTAPVQRTSLTESPVLRWAVALVVLIVAGVLILQKNVNYLRAASLGSSSVETFRQRDLLASLDLMDRAIEAASDVELYYATRARLMNSFGTRDRIDEIEIATEQFRLNSLALEANPLSHTARNSLAASALKLAQLGDEDKGLEAVRLYTELTQMVAGDQGVYSDLAIAYLTLGQPQQALETLDDFVRVTNGEIKPSSRVNYLYGVAYQELGESQEAAGWLEKYLDNPEEDTFILHAHKRLADLYAGLGQQDRHAEHLARYSELGGE